MSDSPNTKKTRPLSPHLSIYKPQISSVLSIGHRITGACMYFSFLIMSWWLILWIFSGFDYFYINIASTNIAKLLMVLTSYAFFYHLCTGVRHLFWDAGCGFTIKQIDISGIIAVMMSIFFTILFWFIVI